MPAAQAASFGKQVPLARAGQPAELAPAWFGIALVFGLPEAKTVTERFLSFGISVSTLILAAGVTYALLGIRGGGIRRFASLADRRQER